MEAITGLVHEASLCETIGESGRAQGRGRFAWATTIDTLETLLAARGQEGIENP
jgi:hypothetical protein